MPADLDHAPRSGLGAPSPWVRRWAHLVPAESTVLDLAAGGGRHTRFFHERGNRVIALDRDLRGMADLAGVAGIELAECDLEMGRWPLDGRRFGAVVVTQYLHRPLLPVLAQSIEPTGTLIYETFAVGQAEFGRPSNPDFLLKPGELLDAFTPALQIIAYEHGIVYAPRPAAVQRMAAVRDSTLRAL